MYQFLFTSYEFQKYSPLFEPRLLPPPPLELLEEDELLSFEDDVELDEVDELPPDLLLRLNKPEK
jgi:hypothetical protein